MVQAHHRLHSIDLATGAELFSVPKEIAATYPSNGTNSVNGVITFDPALHTERAALTLVNGKLYMGWAAPLHVQTVHRLGAYSADTLAQIGVINITANGAQESI